MSAARLPQLLRRSGDELGIPARFLLAVRLTNDEELRALNRRFAGIDETTDVLAFPAGAPPAGRERQVGDIALSVERALSQSADGPAELRLLAVHGLLHCIGHDHHEASAAAAMTAATRRLLPGERVPDL